MANNITGASLAPIYQRLNETENYHPLEADTFADWSMEAGDVVTITRDGNSYKSPVHNSTVTWKKSHQVSVSSTGTEERETVAKQSSKKYNSGSSALRNTNDRYQKLETSYNGMVSALRLESSSAALYVLNKYTQMTSGLKLTESSAHLYTLNKYTQMSSGLKLSESSAHLYTTNRYTQMTSGLKLSESSAHLYTTNKYTQMSSGLKLSESSAHLYTLNKYTQMTSGLKLTESSAHLYTNNKYTQMSAGLRLTESSAHLYANNKYTQMSSGLSLTSSSAALYVNNKYSQMSSGLKLTESSAHLYTLNKYTQMSSGLKLSESSAHLYTTNRYTQMTSGLKLTESSAHLYTTNRYTQMASGLKLSESSAHLYTLNKYTQMSSGLKLTSSSAALYVNNKYSQMSSGLKLTESSARLYVENKYTQMTSGLTLSESSARLYVENKYTQMSAGISATATSAALYAKNRTTKAQIIARINESGDSEALIGADRVSITGSTTINGTFEITSSGYVNVKKTIFCDGNVSLSAADGTVSANKFNTGNNGCVRFWGSGSTTYDLDTAAVQDMIIKAEVSGNTLTLWKFGANKSASSGTGIITFSKATSLSEGWSGGNFPLTISATQNGTQVGSKSIGFTNASDVYVTVEKNGTPTQYGSSLKLINVPFKIVHHAGGTVGDQTRYTSSLAAVDATSVYDNGTGDGWNLARTYCVTPAESTDHTMQVGIPASTYNQSSYYSFTLSADSDYAYVKNALGTTVMRMSISGGSGAPEDITMWFGDALITGEQTVSSNMTITPYCRVGSTWYPGDSVLFKPITVSHDPKVSSFDSTGISKSSPGASSYISGRTRANTDGLLGTGKYFNFTVKCGNDIKNYYIET